MGYPLSSHWELQSDGIWIRGKSLQPRRFAAPGVQTKLQSWVSRDLLWHRSNHEVLRHNEIFFCLEPVLQGIAMLAILFFVNPKSSFMQCHTKDRPLPV